MAYSLKVEEWVGKCATNRRTTDCERDAANYEFLMGLSESERVMAGYPLAHETLAQTTSQTTYLEREALAGRRAALMKLR